ncbi:hypothetical protein LJC40_02850 [Synergistaceae bacterium OttesenSCG-928-D05]|nr:hypothetical protein [Synergistaceae bacterium OttesenSCG-928-D05]
MSTKTVRISMKDNLGKKYSISMGYASEALEKEGGIDLAQAALDMLEEEQPMSRGVSECLGVEVIDKKVTRII